MDLIRRVLEYREGIQETGLVPPPEIPNRSTDEICYHAQLCHEAGFLADYSHVLSSDGSPRRLICRIGPLTWTGHEELQRLRKSA